MTDFTYIWRLRRTLPERKGQKCRIIARAVPGRVAGKALPCRNICIEFTDGYRVVASRWAVRKA